MESSKSQYKQTEVGPIPEDWEVLSLLDSGIDIIDGDRGSNYPNGSDFSKNGYCLFLNTKNVSGEKFDFSECSFITQEKDAQLRKGKLKRGDIVLTTRGTVGNVAFYDDDAKFENIRINSGMIIIRNHKGTFETGYLYQILKSPYIKNQYKEFSSGSAQPQLPVGSLKSIRLIKPPPSEQQKIAGVLGALDKKIELNRKMNKTLEQIGQAIFNEWFIRNAGEDFETKRLGELLYIDRGLSYKGKYLKKTGVPMFNLGSFNVNGSLKLDTLKYYTGDYKENNTVKAGDIIVANTDMTQNRDILGSACIIPDLFNDDKILFTHHVYALRIKNPADKAFIYSVLKTRDFKDQAVGFATGTTVLFLPKEAILNYEIGYPKKEELEKFNKIFEIIIQENKTVIKQIETLSQIRDSLLPRLMSGKLRVK